MMGATICCLHWEQNVLTLAPMSVLTYRRLTNSKFKAFLADARLKGWNTDSVLLRPVGRRVVWGDALR